MSATWWWLGIALIGSIGIAAGIRYMTDMPGESFATASSPLDGEQLSMRARVNRDVATLAADIGERNMYRYDALNEAADFIADTFRETGFEPTEQAYPVSGRPVRNIVAESLGTASPGEIVLFGAHYDTVPGSSGANDNASGVAALLELARHAATRHYRRSLRFVAFVNEEMPYFGSAAMGSHVYASDAARRKDNIVAMFSLETIGYFSDRAGSQRYPFPMGLLYPDTANFIGFVGNLGSRWLVRDAIAAFRRHAQIASEGVAAPAAIPGVDWSDHRSFWQSGYAAVMVTDTALYRYPQYHLPADTPAIIDYDRMALVVDGLAKVMDELAGLEESAP